MMRQYYWGDPDDALALKEADDAAYEKKCPADEVVVVMPCDPYTGAGYFQVIAQMAEAVQNGAADLVLMKLRRYHEDCVMVSRQSVSDYIRAREEM